MSRKSSFWYKIVALILTLVLVVSVLAACGGDNGDKTATPSVTTPAATTPAITTPAATTPAPTVSKEPVKIGVIVDYTGPGAVAGFLADGVIGFAEWYWNEKQGGIQVGDMRRPVEFIKYDNKGQVADAAAGAKKLLLDGVTVVTMGGISGQFGYPIADVTDPANVLYSSFFGDPLIFKDYNWTISTYINMELRADMIAELIVKKLKAKTVGIFGHNLETDRAFTKDAKEKIQALDPGIKIVYEEYYTLGSVDFSPYLTKIKYQKPDVLLTIFTQDAYMTLASQMMELGGWGDIKHIAYTEAGSFQKVEKHPGAQGWYVPMSYLQGHGTPAQIEFGQLWAEKCKEDPGWCKKYSSTGAVPASNHPVIYGPLLAAIKAIELAGTDDRAKVAEAGRSGKLEYDSPMGYLKIGTDGRNTLTGFYVQVLDGKFVSVE
ncbi:MAG: ABC transporter substrate-binding protein [Dehalococcoidia bacterium]